MAEPEAISTRSPGTSSAAFMFTNLPSLFTVAEGLRDAFGAATASPALVISWKPMVALANKRDEEQNGHVRPVIDGDLDDCSHSDHQRHGMPQLGGEDVPHTAGMTLSGSSLRPNFSSSSSAPMVVSPCEEMLSHIEQDHGLEKTPF